MSRASIHLLLGPETGEKERFLDELRTQLTKAIGSPPELSSFYAFDTPVDELLSIVRNGSLFSAHRLVVLKGAEEITKKGDVDLLSDYFAHPAPDATLCLLSDAPGIDKRIEKAAPSGAKRIFWELFENQKRGWVMQYFRRADISISSEACELLLEMVDNNTRDLQRECDKLSLFFAASRAIEEADVESYIYHSKQENVFTLFDRVAAADFAASLEILQSILLSGETNGVALLAGLLWQFRRLHEIRGYLDASYGATEACTKAKVRGKRAQRSYLAGSKNYNARDLENIISLIARYDGFVRGARSGREGLVLELFLYYCIVRRGREPEGYRA